MLLGAPIFDFFSQLSPAEIRQFSLANTTPGPEVASLPHLSGYKTLLDVAGSRYLRFRAGC